MAFVSAEELERLQLPAPSQVRMVFTPAVAEVQLALSRRAVASNGQYRCVTVAYDRLDDVRSLIDEVLDHLAQLALALFPNWYGALVPFAMIDASTSCFDPVLGEQVSQHGLLRRGVSVPWLRAARHLCRQGRPPLAPDFSGPFHAAQLALVIDPSPLLLALIVSDDASPGPGALRGLARTSEWLARHTGARVVVVAPGSLSSSTDLDSISFGAVHLSRVQARVGPPPPRQRSSVTVSPLIGQPHPLSRGEQMLSKRLAQDEMLAGLFQCNNYVETRNGHRYLADLVWEEGKIIVEVDGYEFHSDRRAFSSDRRRDYELIISGYLVLRLPHDEVVEDVDLSVEKVRDMVQYRRAPGLPISEDARDERRTEAS
jgi:very-short-patch-repair endonuclease